MHAMTSYERERFEERIQDLECNQEELVDVVTDVLDLLSNFDFDNLQEAIEMLTQLKEGIK